MVTAISATSALINLRRIPPAQCLRVGLCVAINFVERMSLKFLPIAHALPRLSRRREAGASRLKTYALRKSDALYPARLAPASGQASD